MKNTTRIVIISMFIAILTVSAMGQANKLQDLVNARAGQAERDLENRGYVHIQSSYAGNDKYSYWWNSKHKKCVGVRTRDGRYASITDTMPFDCNQNEESSNGNGMSTGAKVGIAAAAAAIIGAAVIAHNAHHHDNNSHSEDVNREAEFERGYRDGLYNSAYHNYSNSKDYSNGYSAGVANRANSTRHSTGRGGYQPHVNLNDLRGIRASSGESQMETRGFKNVEGFKAGQTSYTIWWNRTTRQCVQVGTVDGRYDSISDIRSHSQCR